MNTLSTTVVILEQPPRYAGLAAWLTRVITFLRAIGPYAAIEILLPGGTLIALLFWLYRRNDRTVSKAVTWMRRTTGVCTSVEAA